MSEEKLTATEAWRRSRERYEKDARYRAQVQGIVARVMQEHGPVNPDHADREAHDIAHRAVMLAIEAIFSNDFELKAQRAIADKMQELALNSVSLRPMPPVFIPALSEES